MRTNSVRTREAIFDDSYFERKARELVVADDEIEAWELDSQSLHDLADAEEDFDFDKLG